jgi:hypothetical protein
LVAGGIAARGRQPEKKLSPKLKAAPGGVSAP